MNLFGKIVESFASGFMSAVESKQARVLGAGNGTQERGRIDRLCRELGWALDERDGDTIRLHFNDPVAGVRKVFISSGDSSLVRFSVFSYAILPEAKVPQEVFGYLLLRNREVPFGGWQMIPPDDDDEVLFNLKYVAIGGGLTAAAFNAVCDSMVTEAIEFDDKMRSAGFLE